MQSDELTQWIQQLASKDWRKAAEAQKQLSDAEEAGLQVVIAGMSHPETRIRRACVDFMDHHGDDHCLVGLIERMLDDPVPNVRRAAVHSLSCDRCKTSPLSLDRIPLLMSVIENDPNKGVRYEAIWALTASRKDSRYFALLRRILETEQDKGLRKLAHNVLYHNDADYKQVYIAQIRAEQNARMIAPFVLIPFQSSHAAEIVEWVMSAEEARYWAGVPVPVETSVFDIWHADPDIQPFVLCENDVPLGYGEVWRDAGEQEVELARILVKPANRGQGIGQRLVSLLLEQAAPTGYPDAFVRVYPENSIAISCYIRAGFAPVSAEAQKQYNQGQPVEYVWLHRNLTTS